ncbi:DUF748 domain-containing protein [Undibacterium sp. CCC2.1]|nr:DUF748 domain-containing protein [Undibacterium sp. CCC2.1]MEB0171998.1 DUF748 domain-containing protein [Undibacterium sp. CCC1.1]MEB0176311.1 DUF748 domain-containing protein [Undibacterium sp. CCC3.4]MEB0213993.1 DUF748 domain-containing protein [Undibacterium sp. 5I2]
MPRLPVTNPFPVLLRAVPRLKPWLIGVAVLFLLSAVLSWAFLPGYVKRIAIEQTQQQIGRKLELDTLNFSPLQLTLRIDGVRLYEADAKTLMFSAQSVLLNLSLSSLFHQALVVEEFQLSKPSLHLQRLDTHGRYNLSDILDKLAATPSSGAPLRFAIANIELHGGSVELDDHVLDKQFRVSELELGLPFISNFPKAINSVVEPKLSARINGAGFAMNARSTPFASSLETRLAIDLKKLDLAQFVGYLPISLPLEIRRAVLSTQLDLVFSRAKPAHIVLRGAVRLQDVLLNDLHASPLLQVAELRADIKSLDLLTSALELNRLQLQSPQVWLAISRKAGLNWASLAPASSAKPAPTSPSASPSALANLKLQDLVIADGQLHFSDDVHAQPQQQVELQNISLHLQGLASAATAAPARIELSLASGDAGQLEFSGQFAPHAGSLDGKLVLKQIALASYQSFLAPVLHAQVSGVLNASTELAVHEQNLSLKALSLQLEKLRVQGKPADGSLAWSSLALDGLALDSSARSVTMEKLAVNGLQLDVQRDAQARLGMLNWLAPAASKSAATTAPASPAWKVMLAGFSVQDGKIRFTDHAVQPQVALSAEAIGLQLTGISSDASSATQFSLQSQLNRKGKFNLKGQLGSAWQALDVAIDAQSLPVAALYPYFSQYLNVELNKGDANAKGQLTVRKLLQATPEIGYDGALSLNDFRMFEPGSDDDFLEWKGILLDGVHARFGAAAPLVSVKKLALNDFFARVILSDKGRLNLENIIVPQPALSSAAAPTSAPASAPAIIRIAQTALLGGNINFTDHFIKPNYRANLTNLSGNIGLIASDNPQAADVELHGKVDDDAPLLIAGAINPLSAPIFIDITGSANGLELTRLTPYAAKYAGYAIEKGKLSMQVSYHIEKGQLNANNSVNLDQLTFGERIDSPTATKLPLTLAIALLRDNEGRIAINLPISGTLSDPQFSVGGIIFKVLVNVITKAVTSPFSLLGSMFGGGAELAYIEFQPGQSILAAAATEKLGNLAQALTQRSGLKLDIIGRVDPASDTEGVRRNLLDSQLREQKWRDMHQKDRSIKAEQLTLEDSERSKYIELLYRAAKFDKPRNVLGIARSLPTAEAEQLLLKNLSVSAEDLRVLAQKRADGVRDYLEQVKHIERERLFLIAPKLSADGISDHGQPNRVDFEIK